MAYLSRNPRIDHCMQAVFMAGPPKFIRIPVVAVPDMKEHVDLRKLKNPLHVANRERPHPHAPFRVEISGFVGFRV